MATNIPSIELQKAIYSSLINDEWDVYEVVPENTSMPYIAIGNSTRVNNHTKTNKRYTFRLMIHSWSKGVSSAEVKIMDNFIHDTIMDRLELNEYKLDFIELTMAESLKESAVGETIFHGIQEFQITITE